MRRSLLVIVVMAASALAGCGDTVEPAPSEPRQAASEPRRRTEALRKWQAPADYGFRVRSSCGEQNFIGKFDIAVQSGEVAHAKGLDESGRAAVRYMRGAIPTLTDLLGFAMEAEAGNADVVDVAYDPVDGHPTRIELDYDTNATDDESCYVVTHYDES